MNKVTNNGIYLGSKLIANIDNNSESGGGTEIENVKQFLNNPIDICDYINSLENKGDTDVNNIDLSSKLIYVDIIIKSNTATDSTRTSKRITGYTTYSCEQYNNNIEHSAFYYEQLHLSNHYNSRQLKKMRIHTMKYTYSSDYTLDVFPSSDYVLTATYVTNSGYIVSYNPDIIKQGHIWIGDPPTNLTA